MLGAVKTEFGKFGDVLAQRKKKLQTRRQHDRRGRDAHARRWRARCKGVEALPRAARAGAAAGLRRSTRRRCRRRRADGRGGRADALSRSALLALIGGQVALHACMAGIRMAAPLRGAARRPRGVGGRRAARPVRGGADRPRARRRPARRPPRLPRADPRRGRAHGRRRRLRRASRRCCRPASSSCLCVAALLTGAGDQLRPDRDPALGGPDGARRRPS